MPSRNSMDAMAKTDICQRRISSVNWLVGITLQFFPRLLWYILTPNKGFWQDNSFSATKEIPSILCVSEFYYRINMISILETGQFNSLSPVPRPAFILFFHICLCLTSVLFHLGFPNKFLYAFLFPRVSPTCHDHFILLDSVPLSSSLCNFLQYPVTWTS